MVCIRKLGVLLLIGAFVIVSALSEASAQSKTSKRSKRKAAAKAPAAKLNPKQAMADLASPDPAVATTAAKALASVKSNPATEALLDGLALGMHPRAAAAALDSLASHGKLKSLDTIMVYASYRNPKVRASAVTAAGAIKDSRAQALVLSALRDGHVSVRAAAAEAVRDTKLKQGIESLLALLEIGDEAAAPALAAMADPDLAREVAELIGKAPDGVVARCLGAILIRPTFKPEEARVQVVRALGKIPGGDAIEQLTNYVGSVPEKNPRQSRREAETLIERKLTGDN